MTKYVFYRNNGDREGDRGGVTSYLNENGKIQGIIFIYSYH